MVASSKTAKLFNASAVALSEVPLLDAFQRCVPFHREPNMPVYSR
jgi:hypothetical protein